HTRGAGSPWRARRGVDAGRDRREERIKVFDDLALAANHQAKPAVEPEHPTTGTHVHEVDTGLLQTGGALDVVAVVRVATVDDDVAGLETRHELLDRRFDESSGNHDPHRSRLLELRAEVAERVRTDRALALELLHHRGLAVVTHTLVPIANQP